MCNYLCMYIFDEELFMLMKPGTNVHIQPQAVGYTNYGISILWGTMEPLK